MCSIEKRSNFTVNFWAWEEIVRCDHWNESYWAALSCGAAYYAVQGDSSFESVHEILECDHWSEKATEQYFPMVHFIMLYKAVKLLDMWTKLQAMTIQKRVLSSNVFG